MSCEGSRPHIPATVALVGCGAVSEIFYGPALKVLAADGVARTAALVDPCPDRTAAIGEWCPGARRYADFTDFLQDTRADLAVIATPNRVHAEMSVACLEKGMHVLCEKPMALTLSQCNRMIAAAEAARRVLAVAHFRRFFPSTQMVKRILDSQWLGAVTSFRCTWCQSYNWPSRTAFKFRRSESGGGVLMDHGTHMIDLLLWWLGDVADIVAYQDDSMGGVEANCRSILRMRSGATGTISLSHDWTLLHENRFVIECERGWIAYAHDVVDRIDWGLRRGEYRLNRRLASVVAAMPVGASLHGCFEAMLRHVALATSGTGSGVVSARAARRGISLIEDCYRSRTMLDMPWFDTAERQRARELADA